MSVAGAKPIALSRLQPSWIRLLACTALIALAFRKGIRFAKMVTLMAWAVGPRTGTLGTK